MTQHAQAIAIASEWKTATGPVQLHVDFYLARPKSVPAHRRPFHTKPPDLDKLVRAVCDSLTDAGIWEDDSQVIRLVAGKDYDDTVETGVSIQVTRLNETFDDRPSERLVL